MAGSYSRELRGRVLAAVEAGESVEAAAERFGVGRSTAYRWVSAARAEGRRRIARLSFGEKIAMMEALRERLEPLKRLREARQAKRNKTSE